MATRGKRAKTSTKGRKPSRRNARGGRDSERGRDADSPLEMPALGWRQVAGRAWKRSYDNNIGLVAAGTAFYGFIAIVPILVVSALIYSTVADPGDVVRNVNRLESLLPGGAVDALNQQLERVVKASARAKGFGFFGALAVAMFGARNAATALIAALNIAYGEQEKRGLARLSLVAVTIMGAGFGLALALLILLGTLGSLRTALPMLGFAGGLLVQWAAMALGLCVAAAGAASLYRFAPCRTKAKWKWVTPGSVFAAVAWLLLTSAFSVYVAHSPTFTTNYGPSAGGIVLLVWLYLSSVVFLFGAEINAELERQTAEDTTEGRDKPLGRRGAEAADEVAGRRR